MASLLRYSSLRRHSGKETNLDREKLEAELHQAQQPLRHIVVSSPAVLFTVSDPDNFPSC